MEVTRIEDYTEGWFIGNFEPSIFRTNLFEVGTKLHLKGEIWDCHYHTGTEINYLVSGRMKIHGFELQTGDVFRIEAYEVADPIFLEDCVVITIKVPSAPGDKYLAERPTK